MCAVCYPIYLLTYVIICNQWNQWNVFLTYIFSYILSSCTYLWCQFPIGDDPGNQTPFPVAGGIMDHLLPEKLTHRDIFKAITLSNLQNTVYLYHCPGHLFGQIVARLMNPYWLTHRHPHIYRHSRKAPIKSKCSHIQCCHIQTNSTIALILCNISVKTLMLSN